MGKKQHQKDKLYLTANEWSSFYGGKKADTQEKGFKKLPFHCCCLSLQPFETPFATGEGLVFDLLHIVPYLKKYGRNPATGKPMKAEELVKLNYHKNAEGKYHCPVTFKVFNENTHIVAVKPTGNVYSYEAIERLNLKTRNMRDLLTDEKFSRSDLITLQDPEHPETWDVSTFYHVSSKSEDNGKGSGAASTLRQMNPETKATLEALERQSRHQAAAATSEEVKEKDGKQIELPKKKAHFSTGQVSVGFTSTVMLPQTANEAAIVDRATQLYQMVSKKGYVRLHTSLGDVNLELHCDLVPTTCHNFIILSKSGFYNQTVFHRSIRNFMIQGGDPSGTGQGGQSAWKRPFKDEFKPNLTHSGRGVLSMANSGPNTNKSQFFITYRSCRHLDGKHTVFGRVVGGLDALAEMERIPTNSDDRPSDAIVLSKVSVFVDPYEEAEAKIIAEHKAAQESSSLATEELDKSQKTKSESVMVGKYIGNKSGAVKRAKSDAAICSTTKNKKIKLART